LPKKPKEAKIAKFAKKSKKPKKRRNFFFAKKAKKAKNGLLCSLRGLLGLSQCFKKGQKVIGRTTRLKILSFIKPREKNVQTV
jgi:hypothetical protein